MIRAIGLSVAFSMLFAGTAAAQQTIGGCSVLPADNIWNTPVDTLPVLSNSASMVATIGSTRGFHADFGAGMWDGGPIGIPFITVTGTQPKYPASFLYDDESARVLALTVTDDQHRATVECVQEPAPAWSVVPSR